MKWTEVSIHTSNEAVESISNILQEAGIEGLVIEDPLELQKKRESPYGEIYELDPQNYPEKGVRIKVYLPSSSNLKEIVIEIEQKINRLAAFHDLGENKITTREIHEEDWATAWKKYYKPVFVTEHIMIKPIWETYNPQTKDEMIIEMDPGMAFGTGTHPTTVLSIQSLERYIKKEDIVIDVGSGSGILSIAASKLGAAEVYAYDLDEVAVKSSKANIEINKLSEKITVQQNNLLQGINLAADLIVSNILAEIIVQFIDDAWDNLKSGGIFITSGIIKEKENMVLKALEAQGFQIIETQALEDWVSVIAKKP